MALPKVFQYEVCPFCWKVRVALALKKVDYEKIEVHPLNKKEIAFSEYKKVPVYIDSKGQQVNDSNQIMKHIDKEFGTGPKLVADENSEAAIVQQHWLEWSEAYVKAVPPLIYDTFSNSLKATVTLPLWGVAERSGLEGSPAPTATFAITDSTIGLSSPITEYTRSSNTLVKESVTVWSVPTGKTKYT